MSWICEITVTGDPAQAAALDTWLSAKAAASWTALPHLGRLISISRRRRRAVILTIIRKPALF